MYAAEFLNDYAAGGQFAIHAYECADAGFPFTQVTGTSYAYEMIFN